MMANMMRISSDVDFLDRLIAEKSVDWYNKKSLVEEGRKDLVKFVHADK